jgi:hypothetical protein
MKHEAASSTVEIVKNTIKELFSDAADLARLGHKELLTGREVELIYSYPSSTQEKDRCAGIGPSYIKRGKRVLYRRRDLDQYFGALRVKTRDQV